MRRRLTRGNLGLTGCHEQGALPHVVDDFSVSVIAHAQAYDAVRTFKMADHGNDGLSLEMSVDWTSVVAYPDDRRGQL